MKKNIIGLDLLEITELVSSLGLPSFRAKQLFAWCYQKGAKTFDEMSDISKTLKQDLNESFCLKRPEISNHQISCDGTQKWLLKYHDGQEAETVFIPEVDRGTLCVSSQVGCTLTCKFCHTGTQTLVRNLEAKEIIEQILIAKDILMDYDPQNRRITNIVMMGMGEPLYNYENVAKALRIIMDGCGFSKRKITLSTSGIVPEIVRCGEELGVNLAISLHAVSNDVRSQIMPINKKYPLEELLQACRDYPGVSNMRRITFEYVMLKGVNDSDGDAKELIKILKHIPSKINLIPFNPWPGSSFECSSASRIEAFASILHKSGYTSTIRQPRGKDIFAACGQLKSESKRQCKN
jgi:23S rRNA (adenine2503-C2)-methyltransferase